MTIDRQSVKIVLLGDENVGKSTLIATLLSENFTVNVPDTIPEVMIPLEILNEKINTLITDTSSRPEDHAKVAVHIHEASVILLLFSLMDDDLIENEKSFDRINTYWLPYIRNLGVNVPVVLVGTKCDASEREMRKEDSKDLECSSFENLCIPLMSEYKEIESCIQCSSLNFFNVPEVFYFAQKAVIYPVCPLYDSREHCLKPACINALKRIFRLTDVDKDGALNRDEFNDLQKKCFATSLQSVEIEAIIDLLKTAQPSGLLNDERIVEKGFLFLNKLFIEKGRLETTWTILRTFGYGEDLLLKESFLFPKFEVLDETFNVELSPKGYEFFTNLFYSYDKDKDGVLSSTELDELFLVSPGNPWKLGCFAGTLVVSNDSGWITLQGFLSLWSMITFIDHKTTIAYLVYLGVRSENFPGIYLKCVKRHRSRISASISNKTGRDVFMAYVIGAHGCGKTKLLENFIGKSFVNSSNCADFISTPSSPVSLSPERDGDKRESYAVNSVDFKGSEKYLILKEIPASSMQSLIFERTFDKCDIICLMYDSNDVNSWSFIEAFLRSNPVVLSRSIPCVVISSKSDLDLYAQKCDIPPETFCKLHEFPKMSISCKGNNLADIFSVILSTSIKHNSNLYKFKNSSNFWEIFGNKNGKSLALNYTNALAVAAVVTAVSIAGFGAFRVFSLFNKK